MNKKQKEQIKKMITSELTKRLSPMSPTKEIIHVYQRIKDKGFFKSKKKILLELDSSQLWYIMMEARNLHLDEDLQEQVVKLGDELYRVGKEQFGWA